MAFWVNPNDGLHGTEDRVVIHTSRCRSMRHPTNSWRRFETFDDARSFAQSTGRPIVLCEHCDPGTARAAAQNET